MYQLNTPATVCEFFEDEVIVVHLTKGFYYSLRDTAAFLWRGLYTGLDAAALADRLAAAYTTDPATARTATDTFLAQLLAEELIRPDAPNAVGELPTLPATAAPFVQPTFVRYDDMQELLALDPIHDVAPGQGWPMIATTQV